MTESALARNPLLIIGIDAADRHLLKRWSADGSLPVFQRLFETAAWGDSRNATGMVAGTVWPVFYTSVMPGRSGRFRGTTQFVSGSYEHADIDFGRFGFPAFWNQLARQGRRCTVIDAPYAFLSTESGVTQVVDWCSHSAWKDGVTSSSPPALAAELRQRYGRDPVGKCDFARLETPQDYQRFTRGLIRRIELKTRMMLDRLPGDRSDLFLNVFSECHCAGHQLWHLHDPDHPRHDPALLGELGGDPLRQVYAAMDTALGQLLAAAGDSRRVLVFCSHGIGPAYTGTHLLDEILLRLEGRSSPRRRQGLAQAMVATWTRLPQRLRTWLTPLQKKLWPKLKAQLVQPGKASRRFFEIIVNDAAGGIRLNLRGREPQGRVAPGRDAEETCAMLERELLAVINPATGQPLISRVLKTADLYPGEHAERLPDLIAIWNRSGPITEAESPSVGRISRKFEFRNHRSGDHTEDDGLFFVTGPGIAPGQINGVSVSDFAPTIAAMLDASMPGADGCPIAALCARPRTARTG